MRALLPCLALGLATAACRGGPAAEPPREEPPPDPAALRASCEAAGPSDEMACRPYLKAAWVAHEAEAAERFLSRMADERPDGWVFPLLLGDLHLWQRLPDAARADYARAVSRADAAGSALGRAKALYGTALAEAASGSDSADRRFDEALEAARAAGDADLTAAVLFQIALRHRSAGRYSAELAALREAVDVLRPNGDSLYLHRTLFALAQATRRLGRLGESRALLEETVRRSEASGDRQHRTWATIELGLVDFDADRPAAAAERFDLAAQAAAAAGDTTIEVHARILEGLADLRRGAIDRAEARLVAALESSRSLDRRLEARATLYLADVRRAQHAFGEAEPGYRAAAALAAELEMPEERFEATLGLAALYRGSGDADRAVEQARRAVDLVEGLRDGLTSGAERSHFLHTRSDAYQVLASSLVDRDPASIAEAWAVVEQAHGRTLREALVEQGGGEPASVSGADLAAVRRRLGPGDLLVEYLLGEDQSSLLAVDSAGAESYRLAPRAELEALVDRYRSTLLRPLASLDARLDPLGDFRRRAADGAELLDALLGPVRGRLASARRLIVVPDRKLHRLPFEALIEGTPSADANPRFLGLRLAVEYLPAAVFVERPAARSARRVLTVLPGTTAGSALPPPRYAEDEAAAVAAGWAGRRRVDVVRESDAAALLADLGRSPAGVLHVAAHAVLDPAFGPRILLGGGSGPGSTIDAGAIAGISDAPELIVLSACQTAEGELVGGEGVLGLVRAFTLAGAGQVVASLWQVEDRTTAALMREFHAKVAAGRTASSALLAARSSLVDGGFVHPYYWAGFVVHGADAPDRSGAP